MIFSLFSELGYSPEEFKRIHLQTNSTTSDKSLKQREFEFLLDVSGADRCQY